MYLKVDEEDIKIQVLCHECGEEIHVYNKYEHAEDTITVAVGSCHQCKD
jgi:hypothetical protein